MNITLKLQFDQNNIEMLRQEVANVFNDFIMQNLSAEDADRKLFCDLPIKSAWRDAVYYFTLLDDFSMLRSHRPDSRTWYYVYFASDADMGDGVRTLRKTCIPIYEGMEIDDDYNEGFLSYFETALYYASYTEVDDFLVVLFNTLDTLESTLKTQDITSDQFIETAKYENNDAGFPDLNVDAFVDTIKHLDQYEKLLRNHDEDIPEIEMDKLFKSLQIIKQKF